MERDGSTVVFVIIIVIVNLEGDGATVILVENLEDALNKERLRGKDINQRTILNGREVMMESF